MARLSAKALALVARYIRLAGALALLAGVASIVLALVGKGDVATRALRLSVELGGAVLIGAALLYMYALRRGAQQDDL